MAASKVLDVHALRVFNRRECVCFFHQLTALIERPQGHFPVAGRLETSLRCE